jgi:hypothetical protein
LGLSIISICSILNVERYGSVFLIGMGVGGYWFGYFKDKKINSKRSKK